MKESVALIAFVSILFIISLNFASASKLDISSKNGHIQVTNEDADQLNPRVYEKYIAWVDYRYDHDKKPTHDEEDIVAIFLYDMSLNKEEQITISNHSLGILVFQEDSLYYCRTENLGFRSSIKTVNRYIISKNQTEEICVLFNRTGLSS